jgi:hypothetical protein
MWPNRLGNQDKQAFRGSPNTEGPTPVWLWESMEKEQAPMCVDLIVREGALDRDKLAFQLSPN